jgi:hypothetical protein
MDCFLADIYNEATGTQFQEMIHIGLVQIKVKQGALVHISELGIQKCQSIGLFTTPYNYPNSEHLTVVTFIKVKFATSFGFR